VVALPFPVLPRPWRVKDRAILVGDAAGYVTKCSGEGGVENPMSSDFFASTVYIYIFGYPQQKQKTWN
jgi:flavin-dependent dehydrogenase